MGLPLVSHLLFQKGVNTARKAALILSVGGTLWLLIGVCSLVGLHLDRLETAGFFIIGFLPAVGTYSGWLARAFDKVAGKQARLMWNISIAINFSYFMIFRPSADFRFDRFLADLWVGWLLCATGFSIHGLIAEAVQAEKQKEGPALASQVSSS